MKSYSIFYMTDRDDPDHIAGLTSPVTIKRNISCVVDFYRRFTGYIRNMMKENPDVELIFGASFDPDMQDEINLTVIASGFKNLGAGMVTNVDAETSAAAPADDAEDAGHSAIDDYASLLGIFTDRS